MLGGSKGSSTAAVSTNTLKSQGFKVSSERRGQSHHYMGHSCTNGSETTNSASTQDQEVANSHPYNKSFTQESECDQRELAHRYLHNMEDIFNSDDDEDDVDNYGIE